MSQGVEGIDMSSKAEFEDMGMELSEMVGMGRGFDERGEGERVGGEGRVEHERV